MAGALKAGALKFVSRGIKIRREGAPAPKHARLQNIRETKLCRQLKKTCPLSPVQEMLACLSGCGNEQWVSKLWKVYGKYMEMSRVGQNRIYTPYMTVYSVISLPNLLYIYCIHMVLANP
jgi:hypothetical protein